MKTRIATLFLFLMIFSTAWGQIPTPQGVYRVETSSSVFTKSVAVNDVILNKADSSFYQFKKKYAIGQTLANAIALGDAYVVSGGAGGGGSTTNLGFYFFEGDTIKWAKDGDTSTFAYYNGNGWTIKANDTTFLEIQKSGIITISSGELYDAHNSMIYLSQYETYIRSFYGGSLYSEVGTMPDSAFMVNGDHILTLRQDGLYLDGVKLEPGGQSYWSFYPETGNIGYPASYQLNALPFPDDSAAQIGALYLSDRVHKKPPTGAPVENVARIEGVGRVIAYTTHDARASWFKGNTDSINAYLSANGDVNHVVIDTLINMNWTVPAGITISKAGNGMFVGSHTIAGNKTVIDVGDEQLFSVTVSQTGTFIAQNIYPTWFGAVGDSTTNDYTALTKMIAFSKLVIAPQIKFSPNKNYKVFPGLELADLPDGTDINFNKSIVFVNESDFVSSDEIMNITYTPIFEKTLAADIALGSNILVLNNTTGLYPGMGVVVFGGMYGMEWVTDKYHQHHKHFMAKIDYVVDGTTVVLTGFARHAFVDDSVNSNKTAEYGVFFFTPKSLSIHDGGILVNNYSYSTPKTTGIRIKYGFDTRVEKMIDHGKGYASFALNQDYGMWMDDIKIFPPKNLSRTVGEDNYGILLGGMVNCKFNNLDIRTGTHCMTFSTPAVSYNTSVLNSKFASVINASTSVDSHGSLDINFINCEMRGAQMNIGKATFNRCTIYTDFGGVQIFGERSGFVVDKSTKLTVAVDNCDIIVPYSASTCLIVDPSTPASTYPTSAYYFKNCKIYSDAPVTRLFDGTNSTAASVCNDVEYEGNEFFGTGTFYFPPVYATGNIATTGTFTFKNNKYTKVLVGVDITGSTSYGEIATDRFATFIIDGNEPADKSTANFRISMRGKSINDLIVQNNIFYGYHFMVANMTNGCQYWNNNTFFNNKTVYNTLAARNIISNNPNVVFTNNRVEQGEWFVSNTTEQSGNLYKGYPCLNNQTVDSYYDFVGNTASLDLGQTLATTDFTISVKAKLNRNTSGLYQPIIGGMTSNKFKFEYKSTSATSENYLFYFKNAAGTATISSATTSTGTGIADTLWHNYTIRFSQSETRLTFYKDGLPLFDTISTELTSLYATGNIALGFNEAGATDEYFLGKIAAVSVYTKALSGYELSKVINNDNVYYSSCTFNLGGTKQPLVWTSNTGNSLTMTTNKALKYWKPDLFVPGTTALSSNTSIGNISSTELSSLDNATGELQAQINTKQATLVSGTNIKTVNGNSLIGTGDLSISSGGVSWGGITGTLSSQTDLSSALSGKVSTTTTVNGHALSGNVSVTASDVGLGSVTNESKATMFTSPTFTGTVSGITKTMVGLGSVENTTLSTWSGSANITTLGTVATGTWNATAIADGKIASALTGKTYNGLTLTAQTNGFTIAGGTTSKTLTVGLDASVSGTNTGDNATNSLYSGLATSKQDALVSGTNIKTINSTSLLGSGDVAVQPTLVSGTTIKTVNGSSILGSGDLTVSGAGSVWDIAQASNQTYDGTTTTATAGEALSFGDVVYMSSSDGKLYKADAGGTGSITNTYPVFGMAVATINTNSTGTILIEGTVRDDDGYNFATKGALVYLSTTAAAETQTAPSGTNDAVLILGIALDADNLLFKPQMVYATIR